MSLSDRKKRRDKLKNEVKYNQNSSKTSTTGGTYSSSRSQKRAAMKQEVQQERLSAVSSQLTSRIDTWFKNNENFVSNYNYRFKGFTGSYNDPYDSTINDWISSVTPQKANFDAEAASIKAIIEENKDYLNPDYVKSVFSALDSASKVQSDILNNATEYSKYWSQWESPDAYTEWQKYRSEIDPILNAEDFDEYYSAGEAKGVKENWRSDVENNIAYLRNPEILKLYESSAKSSNGGSFGTVENILLNKINYKAAKYMTDEEYKVYNYYVGKGDTEKAESYLKSLEDTLTRRQAGELVSEIKGNPLKEAYFALESGADQFWSGVGNLGNIIKGTEGNSPTATQIASPEIREGIKGGWGVAYDLAQTTANMLPSILVGTVTGGVGGAITLGASAAGNAYSQMMELGYEKGQARTYAALVGASETVLSSVLGGISKLGGGGKGIFQTVASKIVPKLDNAIARVAIEVGGNVLDEGLEEAIQEVLDPIFKMAATGEEFEGIDLGQVFYSGLLGMLSGGLLEGVPTIAGNAIVSNAANKFYGDDVQGFVTESLEIDPENAHAQRMQTRLDSGKNVSGYQLNRLAEANETAMLNNDVSAIKTAAASRLAELGESGNVDVIATALTKQVTGERLTFTEREAIKSSKYGERVANELNTENIRGGGYSSAWAEKIGTDRINADVYGRMVEQMESENASAPQTEADTRQVTGKLPTSKADFEIDTNDGDKIAQEPRVASEGAAEEAETKSATYEASEVKDAQTGEIEGVAENATTTEGEGDQFREVTKKVKEIASVSNGAITVRLDNGETVNANEIDFGNEDVALVYQAAADMSTRVGGFNADTVRVFVSGFNPDVGLTAGEYVLGFRDAYRYGAEGAPISELAKGEYTKRLTEEQRNRAFHFGRAFGNEKVAKEQAALDAKKSEGLKKRSESAKIDSKTTKEGDGAMAGNENTSYYDGDRNTLSERQRASVEFLEKVFGHRGVKITFINSYIDEGGRRVYKNSDGKVIPAPNGQYNPDGSIVIDINAGEGGEGVILNTASHELTHFIKDWSPKKFKTFAEFLYEQYGDSNVPLEAFIQRKITKAKERGRTISREVAYEEFVADSSEMMIVDILNNKNEENLQKLLAKDKSLFEKIKDFFADLFKRIKAAYEGVNPQSLEGAYVREMRDVADRLQTMWTEALLDAVDTHEAISGNDAEGTGTKFSLRENVEETKELVAVHNLTEAKLMKSLNLGGLPMPSIAIIKARDGHNAFGDISLVFGKDTIDPRAYRSNKVYSGDAYTPTYPRVEYKINEKAQKKVREKINGLVSDDIQSALGRVHLDSDNLTDTINRHSGDMATAFKYDYTMKYAYLLDDGRNVELPMTEKPLSYYGSRENGAIIRVAENVSREDLLKVLNGDRADGDTVEPLIRKAVSEYMAEKYADQPEVLEVLQPNDQLTYSDLDGYAQEALNYLSKGLQQTVDYKAAKSLIDENIDQTEYERWVNRLFSDIVEKEGIRNNKDYFTPSGNRRSFEALHYEHNLENVIKAMKEQGTQGIGGFGGGNIFGASTTEFGSVEDIKGATDRLKMMSQEEHDEIKQGFSDRFFELASSLPKSKGSFTATDDAANMLIEAVMKFSTKSGMANYLRRESEGWANYSDYIVDDLIELVRDIRNMPTGYFEAKPQRVVGFDEVATAIIPNNASEELKTKLNDWQIDYIEYEKGNDESRLEALNSLEGVRFSDRDSDGKTLTEEQQEFFKDSKVRNEKGDLLVMYHGTPNAGFTKFKSGTYFTQHKWYADRYQSPGASSLGYKKSADSPDTYAVYLNIKKPFDTRNQAEKDIFYNEYYRQWGTGTDLMESGLPDWLDGMDLQEFIEEMGYDYDGLILDEGGTGGYGEEVVSRGLSYVIFDPAQAKNIDNEAPTDDPDIRYSEREIVGASGKNYGVGVYLDSELLSNLTDEERIEMVKEYVKELGGRAFTAYDNNNNAVEVHIAEANKKFKNKSGKRVPVNRDLSQKHIKNKVKQETITLVDELVSTSTYDSKKKPLYSHGWLDNHGKNDWEYWVTYVQDKENTIWKATLNVATTANGEKILYDINPIKKVEQSVTSDTSTTLMEERSVKSDTISTNGIISHSEENVNSKFSERDASGNILTDEQAEFFRNSKARDKDGNLLVLYHGTANAGFTVFEPSKGRYGGNWFTTSQIDADTYAGNYNHKLFDPNETDDIRASVGGNYTLGSWMRFDTEADRADFLRKYPNAENIKTDAEYDALLKEADKARDWDEYDRLEEEQADNRKELKKLQRAYGIYEWEHSREATIGELLENPERFTTSDVLRAYDAYDTNNAARDEEYTKEELIEGLRAENERMIADGDGSLEDLPFKARLPIGEEGEIVNRANNRTYAVYANAVRPYEIDAKKQTLHGAGLYSLIEAAMKREQYDSVIVRDTRVGAHEEIGDVVIIKEANQVKLTSNTAPGQSDDIRYSDRDDFYEARRELKERYGVDTEAVLTMADGYLQHYGGVLGKTQFRKQFLDLTLEAAKFMSDTSGESIGRVNDMVLETASEIVNNPAITGELVDELRKIKKHIKDTRIKIPSRGKGDFDIVGGFEAFRRKHIGRLTLTNDGIDVDAIYPEFQELFGKSWFPDNIDNVPDQLMRIAEVADASLGDYSENYYNSEEVMIDVAGEIFDKVQTIVLKASENTARINYRRAEDNLSPRGLLANALEGVAQNDIEKDKLKNYREKIGKLNAEEQKLQNLRREIKELSFATGPRDTARIEALRAEATKTANRISIYDKQLLELEASKPLRDVLERERSKAYKKAEAEGREALAKYRERAAKTQEELKRRYQESKKRGTENRRKTEIRHKIKRTVGELNDLLLHGSKNRNIKSGLQEAVAAALEAINMDTVAADERIAKYNELIAKATDEDVIESLTKTRDNIRRQGDALGDKLEAMRKAYRDIREKDAKSEYPDYFKAEAQLIENRIESVIDKVGNTPLRNMTYAQLDAVYDMYKMVLATVRNANAVFKEGKIEDLQRAVGAVMTELSAIPKLPEERSAVGDNLRGYAWNELTPYYAVAKIGSKTFESFYWEAIKGQDVYARDIDEARDVASEAREKYHYDAWDFDKIHKFKLADGREFTVSLKHMMSIYAYAKRPQAAEHMRKGGFFFNDKETFRKKGGVLTMIRDSEASFKIDDGSLAAIISAMTEEQRRYVDDMQTYLTQMGEKGNEVTRVLWGIDLFKEKVYFPLKSSRDFIYQANQPVQESSLKNDGMTKETKPGASNPIVLEAFDDVWAAHVNRMSQYHAYVLPIENLNKVLNYGTWANTDAVAVSTMLRSRFGSAANDYLNQFIGDLNGVRNSQGAKIALLSGMFTKFKKTAVAGSLSVVIQQPTAILRAQALIDGKYFAHLPSTEKLSERWEEVKKYAPIAIIKDMGGFDAGAGRQTAEWLNADTQRGLKKISGKIDDVTMQGAAWGDRFGWCSIWEAVKRETLAKNPKLVPTSEEFMKLVGERFTEVIVKTQVYDSTLSRSGYMRSKNELVKMMTTFMGEPTVSANMFYDSVLQAKRGSISKRTAARTVGAVYLAVTVGTLAKSLIYALRDDDDDESYAEKYLQALGSSIINDINPLTWLPGVRDVLSIFDGWEVERTDMALFQDLKNAIDGLDSENKSVWRKIEDFAGAVASFFGLPLKNVMRTAREVYNGFENLLDGISGGKLGGAFLEGVTGKEAGRSEALYDAIMAGDEARLEIYRGDYKSEDAYNTALSKALRENDERIAAAAEARYNGDIAEYMRIAKEIIAEGNFSQDNVVAAINAQMAALKKAEESGTEEQTEEDKVESIYKVDDFFKAVRGGDIATAYAVRENLVNVAIENGEDREDAEKAFESKLVTYVSEQYRDAFIGDSDAKSMLTRYGGLTDDEARTKVRYWAFKLENPEYADLYESAVNKYYDGAYKDGELHGKSAQSYGITLEVYAEYIREKSGLTLKEDIMYIINTLPLSKEQKDALYYLNTNWSKNEIRKAPWR